MKVFTFFSFFLFAQVLIGQDLVSKLPQKKKVVLESFIAADCNYCINSIASLNKLVATNHPDLFLINIHTGGYVGLKPNLQTTFSKELINRSLLIGYPAATVNRSIFSGFSQNTLNPGSAIRQEHWKESSEIILAQTSFVNIGLNAEIDPNTRELSIEVELFYTSNSISQNNFLHIALLEDGIPAIVNGIEIVFNDVLRSFITDPTGDLISNKDFNHIPQNTFIKRKYNYSVPAILPEGQNGGAEVSLENIKLVAFLTEQDQVIITGNGSSIKNRIPFEAEDTFRVYPNPFYSTTSIEFIVSNENELVKFEIYDILGKKVFDHQEFFMSGIHTFKFNNNNLKEGTYIFHLIRGNQSSNKKISIIK
jgi:hypothetical protein